MSDSTAEGDVVVDPARLLGLPSRARLAQRLTKRILRDQIGGGADGRLVDRTVDGAWVVGVLRPETVQVPAHRYRTSDSAGDRDVTDVPVLRLRLTTPTTSADRRRLIELVQRSMPRPVVLVLDAPDRPAELALALTHVSRTDPEKQTSVIDHALTVPLAGLPDDALDINRRDRTDLWALYRDLVLAAATRGGLASPTLRVEEAVDLHHRLVALEAERDAVVRDAKRAVSQQERITLNDRARSLRRQVEAVQATLYSRGSDGEADAQPSA